MVIAEQEEKNSQHTYPLAPALFVFLMCVCVFMKLHITAQSGLVILVILCHSHYVCVRDLCVCVYSPHCLAIGPQLYPVINVVANNPVRGLLDRKRSEEHL